MDLSITSAVESRLDCAAAAMGTGLQTAICSRSNKKKLFEFVGGS